VIHPTALVDPAARLGEGVEVGPFTIVHAGVELGDGSVVGSHCELGHPAAAGDVGPLRVGPGALIRSHTVMYAGSTFGPGLQTGHQVTIREGVEAAEDLRVGTLGVLTNDPHPPSDGFHAGVTIERYAVVATSSVVFPGVRIGEGSLVAAQTLVREDVPPEMIYSGNPGKVRAPAKRLLLTDRSGPAYPWRRHFHRGYPDDVVQGWIAEFTKTGS